MVKFQKPVSSKIEENVVVDPLTDVITVEVTDNSVENELGSIEGIEDEDLFSRSEMNPSNWNMSPDGDIFIFSNTNTGRIFRGTVSQFNTILRISLKNV